MRNILSGVLTIVLILSMAACSNLETDRDRVASAAITYESALDGLVTARRTGLIDDEAYKKIDPAVEVAGVMLKSLKARLDNDENISDETLDRLDTILDTIVQMLVTYENSQSYIDEANELKQRIQQLKKA